MGPDDNCRCTGINDCSTCEENEVRFLGNLSPQIKAVQTIDDMKYTFLDLTRQMRWATEVNEHRLQCVIQMGLEDTARKVKKESEV